MHDPQHHKAADHGPGPTEEAHRFFRLVLDGLQDPVLVINFGREVVMTNAAARDLLPPAGQKAQPFQCHEIFNHGETPCNGSRIACPLEQVRATGLPAKAEYEYHAPAGGTRMYEVVASPLLGRDGSFQGIIECLRDITDRKRVEEELRRSEESYRNLAWNLPGIVYRFHLQGEHATEFYNHEFVEEITGYRVEEVPPGKHCAVSALIVAEDQHRLHGALEEGTREQQPFELEFRLRRKDGRIRHCLERGRPVYDDAGQPLYLEGIILDISERKEAEEALRRSERWFATTLGSIGDAVITADAVGLVTFMNPVAEGLTGWSRDQATGRPLPEVFTIRDKVTGAPAAIPLEEVKSRRTVINMPDHLLAGPGGQEIVISDSIAPIRDDRDEIIGTVLVFGDVTERKRLEQELQKAHKIESLGVLAGGIAHDFNNLLTAILGNVNLARLCLPPEHKVSQKLRNAEEASLRAKDLTQQLLTFSRGGEPVKRIVSPADLVSKAVGFALRGSRLKGEFHLPADLRPVTADEGQLNQVLHNLVLNAEEATPEGGRLEVRAENRVLVDGELPPLPAGIYVLISIRDEGIGIPGNHLPRIFDPYFTTKRKGSGLGLAVCYSILRNHGGLITVDSTPGQGTTFRLYLPAAAGPSATARPEGEEVLSGRGRVLLMDDDEAVREIGAEMLGHLGYEVGLAAEGREVVNEYERAMQTGRPYDAVIMDLTIPGGMGGREAVARLLAIDPAARIIVSSGYATDPIMADYRQYGFRGVVPKPYKVEELARVLHRVVNDSK